MSDPAPLVLRVLQAPDGSGLVRGATLALRGPEAVIGRAPDADLVVADATVSRAHARLVVGPPIRVEALTASNGTFLDGEPLVPGTPVEIPPQGARLQLGGVLLSVVPLAETVPVLQPLDPGTVPAETAGTPVLSIQWDAGQCVARCGRQDLGLTGAAARFLGLLAGQPGEVVHKWDLHEELDTPHLAPLATAVRHALQAAVASGVLDAELLRRRIRDASVGVVTSDLVELTALMRSVVQVRRGHGYVLQLDPGDVEVERV